MSGWGPRVRGPGVWENTGCGTHGVRWKTQGLVETLVLVKNMGSGGKPSIRWKIQGLSGNTGYHLFAKCEISLL